MADHRPKLLSTLSKSGRGRTQQQPDRTAGSFLFDGKMTSTCYSLLQTFFDQILALHCDHGVWWRADAHTHTHTCERDVAFHGFSLMVYLWPDTQRCTIRNDHGSHFLGGIACEAVFAHTWGLFSLARFMLMICYIDTPERLGNRFPSLRK